MPHRARGSLILDAVVTANCLTDTEKNGRQMENISTQLTQTTISSQNPKYLPEFSGLLQPSTRRSGWLVIVLASHQSYDSR